MLRSQHSGAWRLPIALPFEEHPAVRWDRFAVLLGLDELPNIHAALGALTRRDVQRKRRAMARVWRRFLWTSVSGAYLGEAAGSGDAFATLMGVLRLRLHSRGTLEAPPNGRHARGGDEFVGPARESGGTLAATNSL